MEALVYTQNFMSYGAQELRNLLQESAFMPANPCQLCLSTRAKLHSTIYHDLGVG